MDIHMYIKYFYMFNILKKKQNSWYVLIFFVLLLI